MTITERGWAGHFICGYACRYRRNTLIQDGERGIVVSSVGDYREERTGKCESIGYNRWYETMVFASHQDGPYIEADVVRQLSFPDDLPWGIFVPPDEMPKDVDAVMDRQHDAIVSWFAANFDAALAKPEEA